MNVGIKTNSTLFAIDVDFRHKGDSTIRQLEANLGDLPATLKTITGNGYHKYYKILPGQIKKLPKELGAGVDLKGEGGFLVAPPSIHFSGKQYQFEDFEFLEEDLMVNVASLPTNWIDFINSKKLIIKDSTKSGAKIPNGSRNNTLFEISIQHRQKEISKQDSLAIIKHRNQYDCEVPLSDSEIESINSSAYRYDNSPPFEKINLASEERLTPKSLNPDLIPWGLRPWLTNKAIEIGVSIEILAIPLIAAIAGTIGRRIGIKPYRNKSWTEYPNLWGMLVSKPGSKKSPAMLEAFSFIEKIQTEYDQRNKKKSIDWNDKLEELKAKLKYTKKSEDKIEIEKGIRAHKKQKPTDDRILVNDATQEVLGLLLQSNPLGLFIKFDELNTLFKQFQKEGFESYKSMLLSCWNGKESIRWDRVSRPSVIVENACVSIFGTIQPDSLRESFYRELMRGKSGDGFLQRFSLSLVSDNLFNSTRLSLDPVPTEKSEEILTEFFKSLVSFEKLYESIEYKGAQSSPNIFLSDEAELEFSKWVKKNENEVTNLYLDSPGLSGHITKYPKLVLGLSAVFHLTKILLEHGAPSNRVSIETLNLAISWSDFFKEHARHMYRATSPLNTVIDKIIARILAGDIYTGFSVRELNRKNWSGLNNDKLNLEALEHLQEMNILRLTTADNSSGVGRKSVLIKINDEFKSLDQNAKTDKMMLGEANGA
jgi:putative DNA primase/helicase